MEVERSHAISSALDVLCRSPPSLVVKVLTAHEQAGSCEVLHKLIGFFTSYPLKDASSLPRTDTDTVENVNEEWLGSTFLSTLLDKLDNIRQVLRQSPAQVLGSFPSLGDPRVIDLQDSKAARSTKGILRRGFSQLSLAREFDCYEKEKYDYSKLEIIIRDVSASSTRLGHLDAFLKEKFDNNEAVKAGVQCGLRLLYLAALCERQDLKGFSFLFLFVAEFRRVKFENISRLVEQATEPSYQDLVHLPLENWFKEAQQYYEVDYRRTCDRIRQPLPSINDQPAKASLSVARAPQLHPTQTDLAGSKSSQQQQSPASSSFAHPRTTLVTQKHWLEGDSRKDSKRSRVVPICEAEDTQYNGSLQTYHGSGLPSIISRNEGSLPSINTPSTNTPGASSGEPDFIRKAQSQVQFLSRTVSNSQTQIRPDNPYTDFSHDLTFPVWSNQEEAQTERHNPYTNFSHDLTFPVWSNQDEAQTERHNPYTNFNHDLTFPVWSNQDEAQTECHNPYTNFSHDLTFPVWSNQDEASTQPRNPLEDPEAYAKIMNCPDIWASFSSGSQQTLTLPETLE